MIEADAILARMRQALAEPKIVTGAPVWRQGNRPRKLVLAALAEGPTLNAELHITAVVDLPNEDMSFQLCLAEPSDMFPIARFDWRPPRAHTNRVGPHRGLTSFTGLHPFEENAALGLSAMVANNLPISLPIDPEPADFGQAVAYVCATFNLAFRNELPTPPWSLSLI